MKKYIDVFYDNIPFKFVYNSIDSSGLSGIEEIITKNQYDLKKFKNLEGKIFMDIGANIGIATIIMAKLNKKSIIYAYEPFSEAFELLLENITINNITNVKAFNLAVSNKNNKELILNVFNNMSGANSTYSNKKKFNEYYNKELAIHIIKNMPDANSTNTDEKKINEFYHDCTTERVKCISLDEILKNNKINEIYLLKIDCEGAEFDIIYDSILFKNKTIKNIVGEFHDLKYNTIAYKSHDLLEYVKQYIDGFINISILSV